MQYLHSINLCIFDLRIKHKSLRICDLRTGTQKKLADLRFVNLLKKVCWSTSGKESRLTFCNNQNIRSVSLPEINNGRQLNKNISPGRTKVGKIFKGQKT